MWEINNGTSDKRDCFNNANWNDSVLKKCKHLDDFYDWPGVCDYCCNRDICEQYAEKPEIKIDAKDLERGFIEFSDPISVEIPMYSPPISWHDSSRYGYWSIDF